MGVSGGQSKRDGIGDKSLTNSQRREAKREPSHQLVTAVSQVDGKSAEKVSTIEVAKKTNTPRI